MPEAIGWPATQTQSFCSTGSDTLVKETIGGTVCRSITKTSFAILMAELMALLARFFWTEKEI
ncbi:hypothetical protein XI08_10395 [Bradyrhizobium sp. CCBAU 11361]|nr:hypothetical protein [Bradyrhizobium sp. CCBAU 11361]